MSIMGFAILVVIAAVVGMIGQSLAGYSLGGCFISAIVGFIGAFIGAWIGRQVGLPEPLPLTIEGETFPLLWATLGSTLFVLVLGMISRRRR